MIQNRHNAKKLLKWGGFTLIAVIVLGYALFATHDLILGPSLVITEPTNGSSFTTSTVPVKGIVKRIKDISLNGRSITIDKQGNFKEVVLLAPGFNVFELVARDKFGRSKDYRLELVYTVN